MLRQLRQIWTDEQGQVQIAGMLLLCTVVAIGAIAGLSTFRDQLVQEFGDIAVSLESLDQSYSSSLGSYNDTPTTLTDPAGDPPAGLNITVPATSE